MKLRIQLLSDSAFGRGDGITGLINSEVEHDSHTGLPYIKGRTIKGLIVESCANLLYALSINNNPALADLQTSAHKLFGIPGSTIGDIGCLHIGNAQLSDDLRQHLIGKSKFTPQQVLQALTTIRHQTAVDSELDTPGSGTLRSTRVVLRETVFYSVVRCDDELLSIDNQLLAACAAGIKQGGQHRTRGLGWLKVELIDMPDNPLSTFIQLIGGAA